MDLDFERGEVTVRRGKGQKDRRVMLPQAVRKELSEHPEGVRRQHHSDPGGRPWACRVAGGAVAEVPLARRRNGGGSSCFRRDVSAGTSVGAGHRDTTFMSR